MPPVQKFLAEFDANPFHQMLGITLIERRAGYGRIMLTRNEQTPAGVGGSVGSAFLPDAQNIADAWRTTSTSSGDLMNSITCVASTKPRIKAMATP